MRRLEDEQDIMINMRKTVVLSGSCLGLLLLATTAAAASTTNTWEDTRLRAKNGQEVGEALLVGAMHRKISQQAGDFLPTDSGTKDIIQDLVAILHLLGYTDEDISQMLNGLVDGVENILAQLPPEEVMMVELAAGDILGMIQSGSVDVERLQTDLHVIYTIMWPYVDESAKPHYQADHRHNSVAIICCCLALNFSCLL